MRTGEIRFRFAGGAVLPNLIDEVQNRNPSLEAMAAAWQAAAQRYLQAVSLEDPMFSVTTAPASFGSDDVESAYATEQGQKFPWFGNALREVMAQAETTAAFHDLEDSRIRLTEATSRVLRYIPSHIVSST